jgi:hypothetical protein
LLIYAWRGAQPDGRYFPLQFGLAIAATLVLSPHALFYEASLLIIPILLVIDSWQGEAAGALVIPSGVEESVLSSEPGSRGRIPRQARNDGENTSRTRQPNIRGYFEELSNPGTAPSPNPLAPNQRLILVCLFASGYLWSFGALLGFQPLAVLPLFVVVLVWLELPQKQHLGMKTLPRPREPRNPWGESPNAASGKRS